MTTAIETNGNGMYRLAGAGAWLSERKMDGRLESGRGYIVVCGGEIVGAWVQESTGHWFYDV